MTEVTGASPERREILQEILAGLPDTTISVLRVEPEYDLEPEPDENGNPPSDWDPTRSLGDALRLLEPEWPDFRTQWELELVGAAFHRLSRERGLPAVVAVHSAQSGTYFWDGDDEAPKRPDPAEVDQRIQGAAATTGALLDRVELLEPGGLAVAVSLAVPEAHGFLRHGLNAFVELSGLTDRALVGSFLRVDAASPSLSWSCSVAAAWALRLTDRKLRAASVTASEASTIRTRHPARSPPEPGTKCSMRFGAISPRPLRAASTNGRGYSAPKACKVSGIGCTG